MLALFLAGTDDSLWLLDVGNVSYSSLGQKLLLFEGKIVVYWIILGWSFSW